MDFKFDKEALQEFNKLDKAIKVRILKKIHYWQSLEKPIKSAKHLEGHFGFFRYRVGDWRVVIYFDSERELIKIVKVGHRSDVYENL